MKLQRGQCLCVAVMKAIIRNCIPAVLCAWFAMYCAVAHAAITLVESGRKTEWRYLDHGQRPGAAWMQPEFDDHAWLTGRAPLGFGEPDITTRVRFGTNANAKAPTTYFRHTFTIENLARLQRAAIFLRVDDGAVVFLNGQEVARENLPPGRIEHSTLTVEAIGGDAEQMYHTFMVPPGALVAGTNVLAVEVHQCNGVSTDLFLDLQLKVYAAGEEPGPGDIPVAETESDDPAVAGLAALRRGNVTRAFDLLARVPPEHPRFVSLMLQAGEALAGTAERPDLARDLVALAYRRAPDTQPAAYGWARAQLLARTNLQVPLQPRPRAATVPEQWNWIVAGPHFTDGSKKLSRAQFESDLDYLETMIANAYSYADRRGADWRGALDAVRASLGGQTGVTTFAFRLARFLTIFGDPHSALRIPAGYWPRGYLPFLPEPDSSGRVLAVRPDRSTLLNAAHPYVTALDGRPIGDWLRVTGWDLPKASPQFQVRHSVQSLAWLNYLRGEMELAAAPELRVTLASAEGATVEAKLPVAARFRPTPRLPGDTHIIKDGVGYLRITQMLSDAKFVAGLDRAMADLRETSGLVIDVRGNGGGTQDALRTLMPYFLPPGGPLQIVNVAAYRIPVKFDRVPREGFLPPGRHLRPASASVWSEAERGQIRQFLAGFKPDWKPPAGEFSEWHVMGIRHETNRRAYFYDRPVVVLCDAGCGSATDNFLGALKGQPRVTLLGTASIGNSGRMADYTLPNTKLPLTLSQMVSFRADGKLHEGAGVEPDVIVETKPSDYLLSGGDSVLDAAIARLNQSRHPRRRPARARWTARHQRRTTPPRVVGTATA